MGERQRFHTIKSGTTSRISGAANHYKVHVLDLSTKVATVWDLDAANQDATGITNDGTDLLVLDRADKKLYCYGTDGTRKSSKDVTLTGLGDDAQGVVRTSFRLYVLDASVGKILVWQLNGTRVSSEDMTLVAANQGPTGLGYYGGYLQVTNWGNWDLNLSWDGGEKIRRYTTFGFINMGVNELFWGPDYNESGNISSEDSLDGTLYKTEDTFTSLTCRLRSNLQAGTTIKLMYKDGSDPGAPNDGTEAGSHSVGSGNFDIEDTMTDVPAGRRIWWRVTGTVRFNNDNGVQFSGKYSRSLHRQKQQGLRLRARCWARTPRRRTGISATRTTIRPASPMTTAISMSWTKTTTRLRSIASRTASGTM